MAAPTVTLDYPTPGRLGNRAMGVLSGTVNVSSYDTAHPEVTAITHKFLVGGKLRVVANGESSNGYAVRWDPTSKSFKAYLSAGTINLAATSAGSAGVANVLAVSGTTLVTSGGNATIAGGAYTGAADTEAASLANVGTFDFIAVGQLG